MTVSASAACLDRPESDNPSSSCPTPFEQVQAEDWPMYGRDAANTNYVPTSLATLPAGPSLELSVTDRRLHPPVVGDQTLYLSKYDSDGERGTLQAYDIRGSETTWTIERPHEIRYPTYTNGRVVFANFPDWNSSGDESHVVAVDADSGTEDWRFTVEEDVEIVPKVADDNIYVTRFEQDIDRDGTVSALDVESGAQLWSRDVGEVLSAPAIAGGNLYLTHDADQLLSIDAASGERAWSLSEAEEEDTLPFFGNDFSVNVSWSPTVRDGTIFAGESDGIRAVGACTGDTRWFTEAVENRSATGVCGSPAAVDETVYVTAIQDRADPTGWALALDAETGDRLWRTELGYMQVSSATDPIVTDDAVVVTTDPTFQDRTYVLDRGDGTIRRRIDRGGEAVVVDSHLLLAHADGLYGFELRADG